MWKPVATVLALLLVAACATTRMPWAASGRYIVIEMQTHLASPQDVERTLTVPQAARFAPIEAIRTLRTVSRPGLSVVELAYDGRVMPQDLAAARVIARHTFREQAREARAESLAIYVSDRPVLPR